MILKYLYPFILILLMCSKVSAQYQFVGIERGGSIGLTHYIGDLNPQVKLNNPYPNIGGLFKMNMSNYIALGGELGITKIGYDDKYNKGKFEHDRNLNFKSIIFQAYAFVEFNFFKFQTGNFNNRWSPYLSTGLGILHYNPYAFYQDQKYNLRSLGTEGQFLQQYSDRKYGSFAGFIPVAFGIKYWLKPGVNLALEFSQKFTFTDYLDDVSTTYVGADEFIQDASYYLQDRSYEVTNTRIGIPGRQRGTSTDFDKYLMFQIKLTFIPKKYICTFQ